MNEMTRYLAALVPTLGASSSLAQLTDLRIELEGSVPPVRLYDGVGDVTDDDSYTVIRNDSFSLQGGLDILPFGVDLVGGDYISLDGSPFRGFGSLEVSLDGSMDADGSVTVSGFQDAEAGYYEGGASSSLFFSFTLLREAEFTIDASAFSNQDLGGAGGSLFDVSANASVFSWSSFPGGSSMHSGTLQAGTYWFRSSVETQGRSGFVFTVTPSPSALVMMTAGAGILSRRRR